MRFTEYNFKELEPQLVDYWKKNKTLEKLRSKNKKGTKFYFLDGPPYTSGRFHLGHAWNYALKDIALRYKRSKGLAVWDRNGFDVHGLPTEHKVMEMHLLKSKEDIQKFGLGKFTKECEKFCLEMSQLMTADLERMGITVRKKKPYMALKTEFMEGEWALIKKAYDDGRLYYGEKVLTWCQHCETAVAKHECEYENVKEKSIFVKFKIKNTANEYLLIWTTTPWTIPFNLAVMAGPDIEYVRVDVGNEQWILAKALAGVVISGLLSRQMKVVEEFKGTKLEGLEYEHPFRQFLPQYEELKQKHSKVHTVILSEQYVDTSAGTGLVHAAPGCGPEDQEACKPYDIPPFNALTEQGYFPKKMGAFAGLRAKVDDDKLTQALEQAGALLETTEVEHDYPYCWRCHNPVIFRITFQWFFKVEDLKDTILDGNRQVYWVPQTANNAYEAWIRNLKDNSISRQRYWGTPLPIWRCTQCQAVKVLGSRNEIAAHGGKIPRNLHIPWIDKVKLNCSCGGIMKRVPDVIDVWVDAGTTSWNCLDHDPQWLKQLYPADLILEAKEQTRLWFSMLSICSYVFLGQNAYKNVYVYGMLNDIEGRKMSKSMGNIISPYELIDKYGVDVLRYYMCQNNAGQDINFSWQECITKQRNLQVLWNIHKFLISLATENKVNPYKLPQKRMQRFLGVEERYILSRLHSTIKAVGELFEQYHLDEVIAPLEELYLELSRTYIQMIREKSSLGEEYEKQVCAYTIAYALLEFLKMFDIIAPFISEAMYLNLKDTFALKPKSISHYSFPAAGDTFIDRQLEEDMQLVQQIIQAALHAREKAKLGLRWPVSELVIVAREEKVKNAIAGLQQILGVQTNAKAVTVVHHLPELEVNIKPDAGKIGQVYGRLTPAIIAKLAADSPEAIQKQLLREKAYSFTLEGREVNINQEMLIIEHSVPMQYQEAEFSHGFVYINVERNEELDAEGYAREIMRYLQNARKQAGLEKTDRIRLAVKLPDRLRLEKFAAEIQEKVGAASLEFTSSSLYKEHHTFMVKDKSIEVWLEKV